MLYLTTQKMMKKLNDVLGYNLKIYQDDSYFSFTIDSVILANFVNLRLKDKRVLDLGSGNGIVSLLLSLRFSKCIDAVEIQKNLALLSNESIKYNNLEDRIKVYNEDVKDYCKKNIGVYDLILCNPPYFEVTDKSVKNINMLQETPNGINSYFKNSIIPNSNALFSAQKAKGANANF